MTCRFSSGVHGSLNTGMKRIHCRHDGVVSRNTRECCDTLKSINLYVVSSTPLLYEKPRRKTLPHPIFSSGSAQHHHRAVTLTQDEIRAGLSHTDLETMWQRDLRPLLVTRYPGSAGSQAVQEVSLQYFQDDVTGSASKHTRHLTHIIAHKGIFLSEKR